jgi:hypothetical protein
MLEELLNLYDVELREESTTMVRKRKILICTGTFVILFAGALWGGEVLMLEVSEFVKRRDNGRNLKENWQVVVLLMGRFKNEAGERNLVIVLSNVTKSGLQIQKWIDRFTALLLAEGKGSATGPAMGVSIFSFKSRSTDNEDVDAIRLTCK